MHTYIKKNTNLKDSVITKNLICRHHAIEGDKLIPWTIPPHFLKI